MKFRALPLAALGVLCALSSASYAQESTAGENLEAEMADMTCPSGQRPAMVAPKCPSGARSVLDCPAIQVTCVQQSFGNDPGSDKSDDHRPAALTLPKTEEEIEQLMAHTECVSGERPAKVSSWCPKGALDPLDCEPVTVKCVKDHFSNAWTGLEQGTDTSMSPAQTDDELAREMAHRNCPPGQRPAKIAPYCPTRATSNLDCPPIKVSCVQQSFGNDPGTAESSG